MSKKTARRRAIIRRRIFLSCCALVLALVVAMVVFIVSTVTSKDDKKETPSSSEQSSSSEETTSSGPEIVTRGEYTLDANYTNLLLVNGENPLPEDYDYKGNLVTIPDKYLKGQLNQINADVWPYLQAMLDAARAEGIDIGVWSPFRDYATQEMLFKNKITRLINAGTPEADAETEAAKVVARPGTSEHHTGLALDINCANDSFEETKAYEWLSENAADYGFIMRYSAEKQSITGVIHESWHWRFVGINTAKEINDLDMCLEEYVEYKNKTK